MPEKSFDISMTVSAVVRTLLAAGFTITNAQRQPTHLEILCQRSDLFGSTIPYLIVFCENDAPPMNDLDNIAHAAKIDGRILALVAKSRGDSWLSWNDFIAALGGAVPSWRALGPDYTNIITVASRNKLPAGIVGEPWQIFEDTVADGLEFIFGRRVIRLGGNKRGLRVSDMITQTPDGQIIVVDAKASANPFDVTWDNLRPLIEYTNAQKIRQAGQQQVSGALLVAADFKQSANKLVELGGDFLSQVKVPLAFLAVEDIVKIVKQLSSIPILRNAINWSTLLCRNGRVSIQRFEQEVKAAESQRYSSDQ